MADVSSVPVTDWGGLMANAQLTRAQVPQVQAQTALTQQQTQSAEMANQIQRARMPLIMNALSDYADDASPSAPGAGGGASKAPAGNDTAAPNQSGVASPETSWYDPANIDAALRSKYFVPPVTPGEAKTIQRAALIGDPGLLENAKMQRQFRIDQQTAASQYDANNLYDAIHTVVDAEPGHALAQLEAIAPNTAAKIRKMIPNAADEDAAARAYAAHVGGNVHQYTGRKVVTRPDGSYVDEVTGRPIPGVEKSGLTEDQWANLAKAGNNLVDIPTGDGGTTKVPQWRANNAPSLSAWVMQQAAHGGDHGSQPTVGGVPKLRAQQGAAAGIAAAEKAGPGPGVNGPQKEGTTVNAKGEVDPVMSKALADMDFKYTPPRRPYGTSLSPDEQELKNKQTAAAVDLKKTVNEGIPAAQMAQTFYRAAQDILDSKGATTGKWTSVLAHAGQWVPGVHIDATTNYQELAKYLGNAALQAGKAIFPKMTDKASALSLEKLNPAPDMTEPAIRNMLKTGTAIAQYSLDSANRVGAYLRSGGDATRFPDWNAKYFKQADYVAAKSGNGPAATKAMPNDAKISAYAAKHFGGDVAKAKAFLQSQGYK